VICALGSCCATYCGRDVTPDPPPRSRRLSTIKTLPQAASQRGVEPKKLSGLVRGELDWIVMKALEKERDRRYDSANMLANDVRRYLADEPVLARPSGVLYRAGKFARQHKAPAGAARFFALRKIMATVWLRGRPPLRPCSPAPPSCLSPRRSDPTDRGRSDCDQQPLHSAPPSSMVNSSSESGS